MRGFTLRPRGYRRACVLRGVSQRFGCRGTASSSGQGASSDACVCGFFLLCCPASPNDRFEPDVCARAAPRPHKLTEFIEYEYIVLVYNIQCTARLQYTTARRPNILLVINKVINGFLSMRRENGAQ